MKKRILKANKQQKEGGEQMDKKQRKTVDNKTAVLIISIVLFLIVIVACAVLPDKRDVFSEIDGVSKEKVTETQLQSKGHTSINVVGYYMTINGETHYLPETILNLNIRNDSYDSRIKYVEVTVNGDRVGFYKIDEFKSKGKIQLKAVNNSIGEFINIDMVTVSYEDSDQGIIDSEDYYDIRVDVEMPDFYIVGKEDNIGKSIGDVNGDGLITLYDASLAMRNIQDYDLLTDEQRDMADRNENGFVDVMDVSLIGSDVMLKSRVDLQPGKVYTGESYKFQMGILGSSGYEDWVKMRSGIQVQMKNLTTSSTYTCLTDNNGQFTYTFNNTGKYEFYFNGVLIRTIQVVSKDTTPPTISGAQEGKWYANGVRVTCSDNNALSSCVYYYEKFGSVYENGSGIPFNSTYYFTNPGYYIVKATDTNNNVSRVSFQIDTTSPEEPSIMCSGENKRESDTVYGKNSITLTIYDNNISSAPMYESNNNGTYYNIRGPQTFSGTVPCNSSRGITLTAAGTYSVTFYSTDEAGHTSYSDYDISTVIIDKTAPTITGFQNGQWYNYDTITIDYSDSGDSGISSATYTLESSKNGNKQTGNLNKGIMLSSPGYYHISVEDKAGNRTEYTYGIDDVYPHVDSLTTNTSNYSKSIILTGKASDVVSGIQAYQFSKNGSLDANSGSWKNVNVNDNSSFYSNCPSTTTQTCNVSENGTWYFYVKDGIGNVSKQPIQVDKIDTTAPDTAKPTETSKTTKSITVTNQQVDQATSGASGASGIQKIEYDIKKTNGGNYSGWKNSNTKGTTYTFDKLEHNTSYTVKTKVTDNAGNEKESAETTITTEKLTAGTLTLKKGSSGGSTYYSGDWSKENIYVSMIKGTEGSGVTTKYKNTSGQTVDERIDPITISQEGTTVLQVKTTDGTNTLTNDYTINIDRSNPTLPSVKVGNLYQNSGDSNNPNYYNTAQTISWNYGNDTVSGIASKKLEIEKQDGNSWKNYTNNTNGGTITVSDQGFFRAKATNTDQAGNTNSCAYSYFCIDTTDPDAPTIKINNVAKPGNTKDNLYYFNDDELTILGVCGTDNLSGIKSNCMNEYECVNGGENQCNSKTQGQADCTITEEEEGIYKIYAQTTDKALNTSETTVYICVDQTAPEIRITDDNKEYIESVACYGSSTERVTVSYEDEYSIESAKCTYWNKNGENTVNTIQPSETGNISKNKDYIDNGKYRITITDKAGNETTEEFIIDREVPTISKVEGIENEWSNSPVTIFVTATDGSEGCVGLAYDAYSFDGGQSWQNHNSKTFYEEKDNIQICVKDKLDNIYTYQQSIKIKIDKESPTRTVPTQQNKTTNSITIECKQVDQGNSGLNVETKQYGIEKDDEWIWQDENKFTGLKDNTEYKVKTKVTDNAGNEQESDEISVTTNKLEIGSLTFTKGEGEETYNSGYWTNQDIHVKMQGGTEGEDVTTNYKSIEGQTIDDTTGENIISQEGETILELTTTDGTNTETQEYTILIDKQKPIIEGIVNKSWCVEDQINFQVVEYGDSGFEEGALKVKKEEEKSEEIPDINQMTALDNASIDETSIIATLNDEGYYYIVAVDRAGNESECIQFGMDRTGPKITIEKSPEGWTKDNVTLTVTATDINGLDPESYSFDNGENWSAENRKEYSENQIVTIQAKDIAGNISTEDVEITTIEEAEKITAPIITAENGYKQDEWSNQDVTLVINGGYAPSENIKYEYKINDEGQWTEYNTEEKLKINKNGTSTVTARVKSAATELIGAESESFTVKLDKQEPNAEIPTASTITTSSITVTCNQTDPDPSSEIKNKEYTICESGKEESWQQWQTSNEFNNLKDYTHYKVKTKVTDTAGNSKESEILTVQTLSADNNKPVITANPSSQDSYTKAVKVTLTISEEVKEKELQYSWTTDGNQTPENWQNAQIENKQAIVNISEETGTRYLWVNTVTDSHDNKSEIAHFGPYNIDNEKPTITVTKSKDSWTNEPITVTVEANDNEKSGLADKAYKFGDEEWQKEPTKIYEQNQENLTIKVKDKAGNEETSTLNIKNIDTVEPVIEDVTIESGDWTNKSVTITAKAKDEESGITGWKFSTNEKEEADSNDWNTVQEPEKGKEITGTKTVEDNGTWYFHVKDQAGNVKSHIAKVEKIDKTDPTNTAPTLESTTKSIKVTNKQEDKAGENEKSSEIKTVQYAIKKQGENWENVEWKNDNAEGTYTFDNLEHNKEYKVKTKVTDNAGNSKESEEETISTKELKLGTLTLTKDTKDGAHYTTDEWTNSSIYVTKNNGTEGEGVTTKYKATEGQTFEETEEDKTIEQDGTTKLQVITTDGHNTLTSTDYIIKIDKQAPNVTINGNPEEWTTDNVTLTIEAEDINGLAENPYSFNNGDWTADKVKVFSSNTQVTIQVKDAIGNIATQNINIDKIDKELPTDTKPDVEVGTNTVTVKNTQKDVGDSGIKTIEYMIKETGEEDKTEEWTKDDEDEKATSYTFNDLQQNKKYIVKTRVTDNAGNQKVSLETNIETKGIPGGIENLPADPDDPTKPTTPDIKPIDPDTKKVDESEENINIISTPVTWEDGFASITLSIKDEYKNKGYKIQYQVDTKNDNDWKQGEETVEVNGLSHGNIVYARLTDGTNYGTYIAYIIKDKENPKTITVRVENVLTNEFTIKVEATDDESGIDKYAYYVNDTLREEIQEAEYKVTGLTQNTKYTIKVVAKDKAGNMIETVEEITATTKGIPGGIITDPDNPTNPDNPTDPDNPLDPSKPTKPDVKPIDPDTNKVEENEESGENPGGSGSQGGGQSGEHGGEDGGDSQDDEKQREELGKNYTIQSTPIEWKDGLASITLSIAEDYKDENLKIEYQVNTIDDGNWTNEDNQEEGVTVNNLNHKDIVYARITDGTNHGAYIAYIIKDKEDPADVKISISEETTDGFVVKTEATDNESGIDKYIYYVDGVQKDETQESNHQITGLKQNTEYKIKVVAIDKAGNEKTSEEITGTTKGIPGGIVPDKENPEGPIDPENPSKPIQPDVKPIDPDTNEVEGESGNPGGQTPGGSEGEGESQGGQTPGGSEEQSKEYSIKSSQAVWVDGLASITLSIAEDYKEENLKIEYQVNETKDGEWKQKAEDSQEEGTKVEGLNHRDIVYARLTDGTNYGAYIAYIIKDKKEPKTVDLTIENVIDSRLTIKVYAVDEESGVEKYRYYVDDEMKEETTNAEYTVTNLIRNTEYRIKVVAIDKAGNEKSSEEIKVETKGIPSGGQIDPNNPNTAVNPEKPIDPNTPVKPEETIGRAIEASEPNWENELASIVLTTSTGYGIQYQVNKVEDGKWQEGNQVNGLKHGDVVYARLIDGNKVGEYIGIIVKDETAPSVPEIAVINGILEKEIYVSELEIKIIQGKDGEYGTDYTMYKINEQAEQKVTEDTIINLTEDGNYTITAYTQDKAGNRTETVTMNLSIKKKAEETYLKSDIYEIIEDKDKKMNTISRILPGTNLEEFKKNILTNMEYKVETETGEEVKENVTNENAEEQEETYIKTGMKLVVKDKEYTLIVTGDINKDGEVGVSDLSMLKKQMIELIKLDQIQEKAADITYDKEVGIGDLAKMIKFIIGLVTL